jgi:hypothetical protein
MSDTRNRARWTTVVPGAPIEDIMARWPVRGPLTIEEAQLRVDRARDDRNWWINRARRLSEGGIDPQGVRLSVKNARTSSGNLAYFKCRVRELWLEVAL